MAGNLHVMNKLHKLLHEKWPEPQRGGPGHHSRTHSTFSFHLYLWVDAAQPHSLRHTPYPKHVRSDAHGNLLLQVDLQHIPESSLHHALQAVVDILRLPEQVLLVLHPFKIGDRDSAGIAENIRDHEDSLAFENPVCSRGERTIGRFGNDGCTH